MAFANQRDCHGTKTYVKKGSKKSYGLNVSSSAAFVSWHSWEKWGRKAFLLRHWNQRLRISRSEAQLKWTFLTLPQVSYISLGKAFNLSVLEFLICKIRVILPFSVLSNYSTGAKAIKELSYLKWNLSDWIKIWVLSIFLQLLPRARDIWNLYTYTLRSSMYLHVLTKALEYRTFGAPEFPCRFSLGLFEVIIWGFIVVTILTVIF